MASMPNCSLAIVVFAKQRRTVASWHPVTEELLQLLPKTDDCRWMPMQRPLDGAQDSQCRVLEMIATSSCAPISLEDCAKISKSDGFARAQQKHSIEVVIQPGELYKTHHMPGLAVFDMDSTLIQQEVIDELARAIGVYDQVAAITEAAMRGEAPYTDFESSLRARVALLRGVPQSVWQKLREDVITFTPGVKEVAVVLKSLGWKLAVLSGGFTPLANWVKDTLGLDYAYANHLLVDNETNLLTGELVPEAPIVHAQKKQDLLLQLASENGLPLERTIAVGDGSNDLLMMAVSGLGIAFNAKPKVQLAAPVRLNSPNMLDILHILGYSEAEIKARLAETTV